MILIIIIIVVVVVVVVVVVIVIAIGIVIVIIIIITITIITFVIVPSILIAASIITTFRTITTGTTKYNTIQTAFSCEIILLTCCQHFLQEGFSIFSCEYTPCLICTNKEVLVAEAGILWV